MKKFYLIIFCLLTLFYSSCAAIETIFKAGMWWGIILVVLILGLIAWIISRASGKK